MHPVTAPSSMLRAPLGVATTGLTRMEYMAPCRASWKWNVLKVDTLIAGLIDTCRFVMILSVYRVDVESLQYTRCH